MIKSLFFAFLLCLVFLRIDVLKAQAHTLATDGSIGAILHIDPDDDPIVGQEATFFLDFKDKQQQFSLSDCDCRVSVFENGALRDQFSITEPTFTYQFKEKNVYQITVTGTPRTPESFQSFNLQYILRVSREESSAPLLSQIPWLYHTLHYGIFAIGISIVVWLIYKENKRQAFFKKK